MQKRQGTFVTVGNAKQPFDRLFKIVESVLDVLPRPVFMQTGNSIIKIKGPESQKVLSGEDFLGLMNHSSVIIMHAGAGTLIHALCSGHKPIVIPRRLKYYEHIDDHQIQLAGEFYKKNKIYLVENESEMRKILSLLSVREEGVKDQGNILMVAKIVKLLETISLIKDQ